jgi:CMP-N,N'-diacetyllegionaminic acid synthase
MKILAIIPARAGSKSISKKNIKRLGGIPLIAHSIKYALKSKVVDRIVVSTDSHEIARIANRYGAETPFIRPRRFALDKVPDFPVLYHALIWLKNKEGYVPDLVIILRPTSPLRPQGLIEKAILLMNRYPKADSLRAVTLCSEHPYRMWKIRKTYMRPAFSIHERQIDMVRQELPPIYYQSGDIEAIRYRTIIKLKSAAGKWILPLVIKKTEMLDLDLPEDFKKAERWVSEKK